MLFNLANLNIEDGCLYNLVSGKVLGNNVADLPPPVSTSAADASKIASTISITADVTLASGQTEATFKTDMQRAVLSNLLAVYYKQARACRRCHLRTMRLSCCRAKPCLACSALLHFTEIDCCH